MRTFTQAVILGGVLALLSGQALTGQEEARPRRPEPPEAGRPMPPVPPAGPGLMFRPSHLLDRRDALDLTTEQVTRLSALENESRQAREKADSAGAPHREALRRVMEQPAPDVAQLRSHAQALMQAEQGARLSALTTAAQAKAVLTPEQRGRVEGWRQARRGFGRREPMGGPGRGEWRPQPRPQFRRHAPR